MKTKTAPEESSITEMLAPFKAALAKYWKLMLAPCLALGVIVTVVALRWPSYFESEALIFIQPQRIASKIVEAPEKKDDMRERLEAIVQEILSRPRLRAIINKHKVYPSIETLSGGEYAVRKFRKNIGIAPALSPTGVQLMQTFRLSFTHENPGTTFEVAKALSNLFIEESLIDRRSEVQGTEEFLDAELAEARKRLEQTENQVQEFVSANFGKLPEHLNQAVARLETLQSQIQTNSQLLAANMQRKANLEAELAEARKIAPVGVGASQVDYNDPYQGLAQLESALVVLSSRYSEQHPDVIATKKRIQALRDQIARGDTGGKRPGESPRVAGTNPLMLEIRRQMGEADVQITALKNETESLKKQTAQLQKNIEEMPGKEQELLRIRRDYANVKANYERLLSAKEEVGLQSSMIRSQKGAQFRLVEPAEMPMIPAGPPRPIIIAAGWIISVLLFFGIPLLLYVMKNAYQTRDDLESDVSLPVLAVIPPMNTPDSVATFRRRLVGSVFASAASVAAACVAVLWIF